MTRMRTCTRIALGLAFALSLMPGLAFASTGEQESGGPISTTLVAAQVAAEPTQAAPSSAQGLGIKSFVADRIDKGAVTAKLAADAQSPEPAQNSKLLAYDRAAIEAIGTQEQSDHTICCPSYACAYADAVIDGTIHDHDYYTCSWCTWTDWGGGESADRCVGSDEELLREAYDQIASGKPTVIHVAWEEGEHWIALIGYENAVDPDHLTLANFIALDPWDGAQLNAGSKYELYGDGCEHVSDR